MNTRFSALLAVTLAGLAMSAPGLASPRFLERDFFQFAAREDRPERGFGREERDRRRDQREEEARDARRAEEQERERAYGYGYERRNQSPGQGGHGGRR